MQNSLSLVLIQTLKEVDLFSERKSPNDLIRLDRSDFVVENQANLKIPHRYFYTVVGANQYHYQLRN